MPNQDTLIACRVCDQVFFDNKSLFDHYMRLHVGSFEASVNGRNFFSGASHITCFASVPLTNVNSGANLYFGPNSSQRVTPTSDLSVGGKYVTPEPLRNFMQLRGPASTLRPQLSPFSSNFHSAISASMLTSRPKQSSNSSFRFASQPTGQPSFPSPRSQITLGISNSHFSASTSKPTRPLNCHSPIDVGALTAKSMSGGICSLSRMTKRSLLKSTRQSEVQNLAFSASTSKPTRPLNFHSPIDVGLTAKSMSGGTCSLSRMTKRSLLKSTRQSEVQNLVAGCTEPYIMQLEHPIQEMTVVDPFDNGVDNFEPDDIDLTLKL
ncbi:uncharacterized protein LOC142517985 [Primulina tabacum]|uniref:uncharacterized protein LOC142517985 n=1 Tax=Primulina tabacum TaxID=48773 RepID=UPI003F599E69